MRTFMMLPDTEGVLSLAQHSRGAVLLHLPDGGVCDLRRDNTARQLLRTLTPERDGLQTGLAGREDVPAFLRCMQGAALRPGAHREADAGKTSGGWRRFLS